MASSNEFKKIKKMYGEKFMHLCRDMFPTLLENEGLLLKILSSTFSRNSKTLYEDLVNNHLEDKFKNFIYSKIDVEKEKIEIIEDKTPYELLDEAGYDLFECTTEEEIQSFKKYYAPREELCTFHGGRLDSCVVFFAVRKDVDRIKRENFKMPRREDEYGTSVMGIQFAKTGITTVSIKNRYNHSVNNPDATYGNDLEKIATGLTQSFARVLEERNLQLSNSNIERIKIPGYTVGNDGKYYKYNKEVNGIYYCPGNIIIDHGEVKKLENEKKLLLDQFILDMENKTIKPYDSNLNDSFVDDLNNIKKIEIQKDKEIESGTKVIKIQKQGQIEPITIKIDKNNQIIGYKNNSVKEIKNNFLFYNETLKELELLNLEKAGDNFLDSNTILAKLKIPNIKIVGNKFIQSNNSLIEIEMPNLEKVGDCFFKFNNSLTELELPNLKKMGKDFFCYNNTLIKLKMSSLKELQYGALKYNKVLTELEMPNLKKKNSNFLENNPKFKYLSVEELRKCRIKSKTNITKEDIAILDKENKLTSTEIGMAHKMIEKLKELLKINNQR